MRHNHALLLIAVLLSGVLVGCFLTLPRQGHAWDELWMLRGKERTETNLKRYKEFPYKLKQPFQDRCEAQLTRVGGERPTHAEMSECIDLVVDAYYANQHILSQSVSRQAELRQEDGVPRHAKQAAVRQCKDSLEVIGIEASSWWLNACIKQELRSYQKLQRDYGDVLKDQ